VRQKWLAFGKPDLLSSQGSIEPQERGCHANRHVNQ
jgi:hypothetical protein